MVIWGTSARARVFDTEGGGLFTVFRRLHLRQRASWLAVRYQYIWNMPMPHTSTTVEYHTRQATAMVSETNIVQVSGFFRPRVVSKNLTYIELNTDSIAKSELELVG